MASWAVLRQPRLSSYKKSSKPSQEDEWRTVPGSKRSPDSQSQGGGCSGKEAEGRKIEGGNFLNYLCNECEEVFTNQGVLEKHKRSHEDIQLKETMHCDDCDQEVGSESALQVHMKKQHEDGDWTCDDCQFQSNSSEYLRQH